MVRAYGEQPSSTKLATLASIVLGISANLASATHSRPYFLDSSAHHCQLLAVAICKPNLIKRAPADLASCAKFSASSAFEVSIAKIIRWAIPSLLPKVGIVT